MNWFIILIYVWPYIWNSGGNDFAKSIDTDIQGKIIGTVWVWDTLYRSVILKFDQSGNLLWESYILPDDAKGSCIEKLKTYGEKIYAVGHITLQDKDIGTLWKIDPYGNVLQEIRWTEWEYSYIKGIDIDQEGNIYLVGNIYQDGKYRTRILKCDTLFNILWEVIDSSSLHTYGNDIAISQNFVYICGEEWDTITSKWKWSLSQYGKNGGFGWKNIIAGNPSEDNHGLCVACDENENVYTGGYYWQPPGYNWWIEKRNASGIQMWAYSIGLSNVHDILFDIDVSGNYVLLAGYKDIPPTWRWAMEKRDKETGSLICSHTFSMSNEERFGQAIGIKGIENGYMYIIGHRLNVNIQSWDVRVALYDPNCNMVEIKEKEISKETKSYLRLNPFKGITTIISDSKEPFIIYTLDGRKIKKVIPGEIFGKELPPGKYYLKRKNEILEFIKLGG
ncbi:MAG: hypothetical protein ABIM60_01405 [candidate division WOR-3 bacterium]